MYLNNSLSPCRFFSSVVEQWIAVPSVLGSNPRGSCVTESFIRFDSILFISFHFISFSFGFVRLVLFFVLIFSNVSTFGLLVFHVLCFCDLLWSSLLISKVLICYMKRAVVWLHLTKKIISSICRVVVFSNIEVEFEILTWLRFWFENPLRELKNPKVCQMEGLCQKYSMLSWYRPSIESTFWKRCLNQKYMRLRWYGTRKRASWFSDAHQSDLVDVKSIQGYVS